MTRLELLKQVKDMGFKYIRISLTKDCNGACSFCHNEGQGVGKRGDKASPTLPLLSLKDFEYIAKFFRTTLSSVSFTGGEPTLVSNLPEIIKIFKDNGYKTSITTNGFLLDKKLQQKLSNVGLDKINVSVPSLDEKEYDRMYGVKGKLPSVIRNLESLSETFKDKCKINYMALLNRNTPSQLVPMSNLSGKLGIPVSFLTVLDNETDFMSSYVLSYLRDHIGIKSSEVKDGKFGTKTIYTLHNGAKWEFDDFREEQYREKAFDNEECKNCENRKQCVEGPYALRISADGTIRKCLIRKDNLIPFNRGYCYEN